MTEISGTIDLLIRGGRVIDPIAHRDEETDIAVAGGRIVAIEQGIDVQSSMRVVDAHGLIVTPGLIDLHVHAYHGVNTYGMDVDPICLSTGVTTAVDAGSSGPVNFAGFRDFVVARSTTRLLGFVAVAQHGVTRDPGDLVHPDLADPKGAARVVIENPNTAVGIKVRLASDKVATDGRDALDLALTAGQTCGHPIMVHIGETPLPLEEIVAALRPGDIITHCFTPLAPSVTDRDGALRPAMLEARSRGIIFDVAHAGGHFSWEVAGNAIEGGLSPDALSTDIHGRTDPVARGFLLPDVMSKFLALGLDLVEVIRLATLAPARIIGKEKEIGALRVGGVADIAILELVSSPTTYVDTEGTSRVCGEWLRPRATIRAGELHEPSAQYLRDR